MLLTIKVLEIAIVLIVFGKVLDLFFLWLAINTKNKNKIRMSKIAYFFILVFETITRIGMLIGCLVPAIFIIELLN